MSNQFKSAARVGTASLEGLTRCWLRSDIEKARLRMQARPACTKLVSPRSPLARPSPHVAASETARVSLPSYICYLHPPRAPERAVLSFSVFLEADFRAR
ncbi:hypothetical protein L596_025852 [Steinernema carpocapsae]|uniref:Uncharacterized protein n=1 Tax=Steinernema carpocapsae TaxID=34508 RepID=A0A4U5M8Y7_STECR|nr:hypothetical protein L596_025852 [Steinernema carpocapsae]